MKNGVNTHTDTKTPRNGNIELLRVICIIAIIAHHFAIHPNWNYDYNSITVNRAFLQTLCIGGKLGVNCFLLISGYFLVNKQRRGLSSILKLWFEVVFYSVMIPVSMLLVNRTPLSSKTVILAFFPVTMGTWKYASAYFVLMLFVPFYNILLQGLSKESYQKLLLLFGICWCLIPTISGSAFESNYLCWMFAVYSVGGYIRLFPNQWTEKLNIAVIGAIIFFSSYLISFLVMDMLGTKVRFFAVNAREIRFGQMQMIPCVGLSVSVFLIFKNLRTINSKFVEWLASGVFGVYLIHEHPMIRTLLWEKIFRNTEYYNSKGLPLYATLSTLSVFVCCELIESLRKIVFEKQYMRSVNNLEKKY